MKTIFSTAEVHARDRFAYWHDVACQNLVDHASVAECRKTFSAELRSAAIADIALVDFGNSAMRVSHTKRHVAHASTGALFFCKQAAGVLMLEQSGRQAVLNAGDMTLLDALVPYHGQFSAGSRTLVLKVPHRLLEARIGKTRDLLAQAIAPRQGEAALISAYLGMLPSHLENLSYAAEEIVQNQVLDLIGVSLAKALQRGKPRVSSARSLALMNVRAAIAARLTDPSLDAQTVADAAGVSVRYANAVLADESTSILQLIRAQRLDQCRRALTDPVQSRRLVSEIAYSWGFSDMTHFGRAFRKAYEVSPSEYRRRQAIQRTREMDPTG